MVYWKEKPGVFFFLFYNTKAEKEEEDEDEKWKTTWFNTTIVIV